LSLNEDLDQLKLKTGNMHLSRVAIFKLKLDAKLHKASEFRKPYFTDHAIAVKLRRPYSFKAEFTVIFVH